MGGLRLACLRPVVLCLASLIAACSNPPGSTDGPRDGAMPDTAFARDAALDFAAPDLSVRDLALRDLSIVDSEAADFASSELAIIDASAIDQTVIDFAPACACRLDTDCPTSALPRCDAARCRCVACLSTNDNCGVGLYCQSESCVPGCKADSDCSGDAGTPRCDLTRHACVACLMDTDCGAGQVCLAGQCAKSCNGSCPSGQTCCGALCIDLMSNAANCGACGQPCPTGYACCGGRCTNVGADPSNCGACGTKCACGNNTAQVFCQNGVCAADCASGFANCGNGNQCTAGCETNTGTDVQNCGGCGMKCSFNHITASCTDGSCESGACAAGWNDCNQNKRLDGCESNPETDPMNCGACGNVCPGAMPLCSLGKCASMCAAPLVQCAAGGACIDLQTDPAHCGSCQNACSNNHVSPTCSAGVCGGNCDPGYADCDGTFATTGCQTNVSNDPDNCGMCGLTCSSNHVTTRSCGAGANGPVCNGPCAAGFGDCNDNKLTDGCETNLMTNNQDCGACGYVCPAGISCVNGSCPCPTGLSRCVTAQGPQCINTQQDVLNCGGCAIACSTNNVTPACTGGMCTGACASGFLDCNGNKQTDGCEINSLSDVLNCGGCGDACSTNNVMPMCAAGSCNAGVCITGFADCNMNLRLDGCEINVQTDPLHCGACASACSSNNIAVPACSQGVCSGACNAGFADCNQDKLKDGCEANLNTDNANCGTCGVACTIPMTSCQGGQCRCPMGQAICSGACIDITSNVADCGGCNQKCSSNHIANPTCARAVCNGVCDSGWGDCDNDKLTNGCETDLTSNQNNCGVCGNACPMVASCTAGKCVCPTMGQIACGASCVDPNTDVNNCGGCGNVCPVGAPCVGGACSCPIGDLVCGGLCVDPNSNVNNCGGCGSACSTNHVLPSCSAGACVGTCFGGYGDCNHNLLGDGCETDLTSDPANCGACGNACGTGTSCVFGSCVCTGGTILCGAMCVSPLTSPTNCGACGRSCSTNHVASVTCAGGVCNGACAAGWGDCNNDKYTDGCETDLTMNDSDCGACGNACPTGTTCTGGVCLCSNMLVACGGGCVDVSSDPKNCGACSHVCAFGATCQGGACVCPNGQMVCGSQCVDTSSSLIDCGGCNQPCSVNNMATFACSMGACTGTCSAGYADCDKNLRSDGCEIDLMTDVANCGACNNACPSGADCQNGACVCPLAGEAACGGACIPVTSDPAHCGGCAPCSTNNMATVTCASSVCNGMCNAGFADCNNNKLTDGCEANLSIDSRNCGACGMACATGATCQNGACVGCATGLTACGGQCVNTSNDGANCGACGKACPTGATCVSGACFCGTGRSICNGLCVDTGGDPANCGACGHACPSGASCANGACACATGFTVCGAACVDTSSDGSNCGACGHVCPTGATCQSGACLCSTGLTLCGGACVNTASDTGHCGGCATACPTGAACVGGACSCPSGQSVCGGACVDLNSSSTNCGACGNACTGGTTCQNGGCCATGLRFCHGACTDTQTDNSNCGACGNACATGATCQSGTCTCSTPGFLPCGGTCTNVTTDNSNCGACGHVCPTGMTCQSGTCS